MRVIAGSARGCRLTTLRGDNTRPTPDRVREALFSIIGTKIVGARILDLFAGSGALGIEAMSRGGSQATFVEQQKQAVRVIEENLKRARIEGQQVLQMRAAQAINHLQRSGNEFDLVFLDPPYDAGLLEPTLSSLATSTITHSACTIVCEHPSRLPPPCAPTEHHDVDTRRYGEVSVTLFTLKEGGAGRIEHQALQSPQKEILP